MPSEDWRKLKFIPAPNVPDKVLREMKVGRRFYTCLRHGWDALDTPCPKCKTDPPTQCTKHGWSATGIGCPKCKKGEP